MWITDLISGLKKKKLYPLYRSGWDLHGDGSGDMIRLEDLVGSENSASGSSDKKKEDKRIAKKPVDVWGELIDKDHPLFHSSDVSIKEQIKVVNRRLELLKELGGNTQDEEEALAFLEARQVYLKAKKPAEFLWPIVTFTKAQDLVNKYKLAFVNFGSYSKTIPMEAIDELEAYLKEYANYRNDKPVLRLIIDDAPEEGKNVSKERKKDPILLASSPFGKYWHFLGAWDKEVQYVDELVYHGK